MNFKLDELKTKIIDLVSRNDVVIIAPHNRPDCDAIASTLAMYMIVKKLGKTPYILINDNITSLDRGVQVIIDELPDSVKIIKKKNIEAVMDNNSLLICMDNNKKELFGVDDYNLFNDILVIDHHFTGETTINTSNLFINISSSSTSEIMVDLYEVFGLSLKSYEYTNQDDISDIANYLLTGIYSDTDGYKNKRTHTTTFSALATLTAAGADLSYAHSLFIDDLRTDKLVNDMINLSDWRKFNVAIASNTVNPKMLYTKEVLSKIANKLIMYKDTCASFSIGLIDGDKVGISARGTGIINVCDVMQNFGGGGDEFQAAAMVKSSEVPEVRCKLEKILYPKTEK